jgi:hypothetical protein
VASPFKQVGDSGVIINEAAGAATVNLFFPLITRTNRPVSGLGRIIEKPPVN